MPGKTTRQPKDRPGARGPADRQAERRLRALEERLAVRWRPEGALVVAEVRNPFHQTMHRVYFPAFPALDPALCDCTDFARGGAGTCKHVEAARLEPASAPPRSEAESGRPSGAAVSRWWREVDRRLASRPDSPGRRALSYRRAGSILTEPAPG